MLLRKLTAAFCPLLLCLVTCILYRWLDGVLGAGLFMSFLLKGVLLGLCAALILPSAGIKSRANGLTLWLLIGAGVLLVTLVLQYLETIGAASLPLLKAALGVNGQVVLVESTVMGFMTLTALLNHHRTGK